MATTLFLQFNTATSFIPTGGGEKALLATRDTGAASQTLTTTTSGNHLTFSSATEWWVMQVAAVTISGTVTFNFWADETNMANNAQIACVVSRYDSTGTFVSDVVDQANAGHAKGTEAVVGTSSVNNWTATPTNTTFIDGDLLVVRPHCDAIGTMAAAVAGFRMTWGGATGGADGDTFVTFTETIVAGSPAAATQIPYVNPMPPLIAQ